MAVFTGRAWTNRCLRKSPSLPGRTSPGAQKTVRPSQDEKDIRKNENYTEMKLDNGRSKIIHLTIL